MIIDLPIVEIRTPYLQQKLYLQSLNLLIGRSTSKYYVWNITQNQIQINGELTQLIEQQQKIMSLPNENRVLGQIYLIFTIFDLKECKIMYQYTIQSLYQLHPLDTDLSSQRLFLNSHKNSQTLIYNLKNWKKQMLFQKFLGNGQFGKYTYCLYNHETKNIYRSKLNKKIRTFKILCYNLNYSDNQMIYENQNQNGIEGVNIQNNIKLQSLFFNLDRQLNFSLVINNFILVLSLDNMIIIDVDENKIIKQTAIGVIKKQFELSYLLGYLKNKCIYVFITSMKYKI